MDIDKLKELWGQACPKKRKLEKLSMTKTHNPVSKTSDSVLRHRKVVYIQNMPWGLFPCITHHL